MFDIYYVILVIPTVILSIIAQVMVKSSFAKYSKIKSINGMTGKNASTLLMQVNRINNVRVEKTSGYLSDHYDSGNKVLRLSEPVYGNTSIAAIGVAAHETGHAIQDKVKYSPLILRSLLVPAANIGSSAGPYMAMAGLIFRINFLLDLGIILFAAAVLFYIVTLPVEIDASRRALIILKENRILSEKELKGVRAVLTAAAFTYIASALTAVANLLRLIFISRDRK